MKDNTTVTPGVILPDLQYIALHRIPENCIYNFASFQQNKSKS